MKLSNILLHVDGSRSAPARIALAADLARRSDAHLSALYVYPRLDFPAVYGAELPPEYLDAAEAENERVAIEIKEKFEHSTTSPDLRTEWVVERGDAADKLITHGRYADLLIVGQPHPDEPSPFVGIPDEVILAAGRPVLVVPYIGPHERTGKRVIVAWNASREAARAVNDALPMLENAEEVHVLVLDVNKSNVEDAALPGADICLHLARHGIDAEAHHVQANEIDVANLLLSQVSDLDADLLVMGAYGHSRLREIMLGGATRDVLSQMTVPVLMSH